MASIQTTAHPPSRAASFQRLLDLEKKYRRERFQASPQQSTASSPIAESFNGRPPHQVRSADSLSQYQNDLMLKAIRRNVGPPSLSITIPPRNRDLGIRAARGPEPEYEEDEESDLENVEPEPLQKSVKFLAPESESDDDDSDQPSICQSPSWEGYGQKKKEKKMEAERKRKEREQAEREAKAAVKSLATGSESGDDDSDQSSICQSPSWEGYGQKKKEKKMEAERKRKEREQAEREARAARKKLSSRLSKAPPVSMRQPPMERSNSAPLLDTHRFSLRGRAHQLSVVEDESELAEDQTSDSRSVTPDPKDFLSSSRRGFLGGVKLEQERKAAVQHTHQPRLPSSSRDGLANGHAQEPRQPMQKSYSDGPGMDMSHLGRATATASQGFKIGRDSCPPSASRTPQLRHVAADRELGRSNSFLQSTSKMFREQETNTQQIFSLYSSPSRSQESLHTSDPITDRSRPDDGYVRRQRDQNTECALAGLAEEQLSYSIGVTDPSKRTSPQPTEQPSPSHGAKRAATKLFSREKTTPAATALHADEPAGGQGDYFALSGHSYSRFSDALPPMGSQASSITDKVGKQTAKHSAASTASQEQVSTSNGSSATESSIGKKRSLKNAAVAALHISPAQPPSGVVKIPPYLALRNRLMSSSAPAPPPTVQAATVPVSADVPRPPKAAHGEYTNPSSRNQHPESRVSEGSTSSSNYDDVSPLPSPATTPDTSRPQSAKGAHPTTGEVSRAIAEKSTIQDDQRTLRRTSETSSGVDSASITPRPGRETGENMTDEDRWSRTAMPIDIDFDAPDDGSCRVSLEAEETNGEGSHLFGEPDGPTRQPQKPNKEPAQEHRHTSKPQRRLRKQRPELEPNPAKEPSEDSKSIRSVNSITKPTSAAASTKADLLSTRFMSPIGGLVPSYGFSSHPFFVDFSEINKSGSDAAKVTLPLKVTTAEIVVQGQAPAQGSVSSPAPAILPQPAPTARQAPGLPAPEAPKPAIRTTSSPPPAPTAESKTRSPPKPTATPVSILKSTPQPPSTSDAAPNSTPASKPHVLSAVPKHLQSQTSARGAVTTPEARMAPIAKMFVECCSCHFYHDMPSKLYECMAKPDAVVEDRNLGISGAITTMVKCPWCQHNMSTKCCAGYAAVVYVKEKLH